MASHYSGMHTYSFQRDFPHYSTTIAIKAIIETFIIPTSQGV